MPSALGFADLLLLALIPYSGFQLVRLLGGIASLGYAYLCASPLLFFSFRAKLVPPKKRPTEHVPAPEDLLRPLRMLKIILRAPKAQVNCRMSRGTVGPAITPAGRQILVLQEHLADTPDDEQYFALAYACVRSREYDRDPLRKVLLPFAIPFGIFILSLHGAYLGEKFISLYALGIPIIPVYLRVTLEDEIWRCEQAISAGASPDAAIRYYRRYSKTVKPQKNAVIATLALKYGLPAPETRTIKAAFLSSTPAYLWAICAEKAPNFALFCAILARTGHPKMSPGYVVTFTAQICIFFLLTFWGVPCCLWLYNHVADIWRKRGSVVVVREADQGPASESADGESADNGEPSYSEP